MTKIFLWLILLPFPLFAQQCWYPDTLVDIYWAEADSCYYYDTTAYVCVDGDSMNVTFEVRWGGQMQIMGPGMDSLELFPYKRIPEEPINWYLWGMLGFIFLLLLAIFIWLLRERYKEKEYTRMVENAHEEDF